MENDSTNASQSLLDKLGNHYLACGIIFMVCCLLYANTLTHQYAYDDLPFIVNNEFVQDGFSGIGPILSSSYWDGNTALHNVGYFSYRPIPALSFALETALFQGNPFVRHLFQILFYALLCVCLFLLLRTLFPKTEPFLLLGICLLFAAHPLHTEIVANLKNRDELLGLLWATLGLFVLAKNLTDTDSKSKLFLNYGLGFLFVLLGLLSKETCLIFLAATMAFLFFRTFFNTQKTTLKPLIGISLPMLFAFVVWWILRLVISGGQAKISDISAFDNPILFATNSTEVLATKLYALGKMQQLLWLPYALQYDYGFAEIVPTSFANPMVWVALVSILLLGFLLYKCRKQELVVYAICIYFTSIAVMGNLFFVFPVALAERFLLIPSLFVCLLIASLFKLKRLSSINKLVAPVLFSLIFILFSVKTISRNPVWHNNETLFTNDAKAATKSIRANFHYGNLLLDQAKASKDKNKAKQAIQYFQKSIDLQSNKGVVETYLSMSKAYELLGNSEKANEYLQIAKGKSPENASTLLQVAQNHIQKKEFNQAQKILKQIIQKNPKSYQAHLYLGFTYGATNDLTQSIRYLEKAYQLNPNSTDVCRYLIQAYTQSGDTKAAQQYQSRLEKLQQ